MSLGQRFEPRPRFRAAGGRRSGTRVLARLRADLGDRQLSVLRSLELLHFATTRQVQRMNMASGGASLRFPGRAAHRCLTGLYDAGLVERLDRKIGGARPGSDQHVWRISTAGARLLGVPDRHRRHQPGVLHMAHVLDVAELVVRLHEQDRPGIRLTEVQSEPECWRWFNGRTGRQECLKPDIRVTLAAGEQALHWFVEVDRGTEGRKRLAAKLRTYIETREDGGEQARCGCFPRVLWVVPDEHRAGVLEAVIGAIASAPSGLFLTAVAGEAIDVLSAARRQT